MSDKIFSERDSITDTKFDRAMEINQVYLNEILKLKSELASAKRKLEVAVKALVHYSKMETIDCSNYETLTHLIPISHEAQKALAEISEEKK